jgi:hypothetical protein
MAYQQTYSSLIQDITTYTNQGGSDVFAAQLPQIVLFAQRQIARELKILGLERYIIGTFTANEGVVPKPTLWLNTNSMRYGGKAGAVYSVQVTAGGSGYQFPPIVTGGTNTSFQAFVQGGQLTQVGIISGGNSNMANVPLTITAAADDPGTGAAATAFAYSGNNTSQPILERTYEFCRFYWPDPTQTGNPEFYSDYGYNNWLFVPTPAANLPIEIAYQAVAEPLDATNQTNWLTLNAPDLLFDACMLQAFIFLQRPESIQLWQSVWNNAKAGFAMEDDSRATDRSATGTRPAMMAPPGGPPGGGQ